MSVQGMPDFGPMRSVNPDGITNALLNTLEVLATQAAGERDTREVVELADACLKFAQALVILDPGLTATGEPLDHQLALEQVRQDGQVRLEEARARAAAPTPSRRKLSVVRDNNGRMAGIESEG